MRAITISSSALILSVVSAAFASETAPPIQWIDQFGSSSAEKGRAVAVDSLGDIYFAFYTSGNIGDGYSGDDNIFLRKYDSAGRVLWTEPLGISTFDRYISIVVDGLGDVYVAGTTHGSLSPTGDGFLSKYSPSGSLHWSQQFGTSSLDFGFDVCVDGQGNVFVSGLTEGAVDGVNAGGGDAFLVKFDSGGNQLWSRQYGTSGYDFGEGIAADAAGNVYVTGNTNYGYPITDIDTLVLKYDPAGAHVWTREINPSGHFVGSSDIAVVGDTVYVIGDDLVGSGNWDAFLAAYDTAGNYQSYFRWGTSGIGLAYDLASELAVAPSGGLLVTGVTRGDLAAENQGSFDVFLTKFDATGSLSWTKQFGSSGSDYGNSVAIDGSGNIYVGGDTTGALGGSNAGYFDAYLAKLSLIPEPGAATLALAACASSAMLRRRRHCDTCSPCGAPRTPSQ
jgi:hypothetical protein